MAASSTSASAFASFYGDWISRHEELLRRLDRLISPEDGFDRCRECREMIPTVMAHYRELFREKARLAAADVFLALSPPWLSSFERALLWISGFRPSMLFPIVEGAVAGELSAEQRRRMAEVRAETRRREKEIGEAMARVQETVAEPPVCEWLRRFGKSADGEVSEVGEAIGGLKAAMVAEVENADELRGWTAVEVVEILGPVAAVKVLAAAARFQLESRNWGMRKDSEREGI
ncbi:protein ZW2-like [Andrographis paniculata]|uniref:protein ZW2-like n=1 Tax=Andrographis paniculata TaxID=175694 RepID=UPI0021E8CAFE|nr:protein ZW2-like [Andrographis paniculata]